jgi:hypothetical protein
MSQLSPLDIKLKAARAYNIGTPSGQIAAFGRRHALQKPAREGLRYGTRVA